jgi:PAS domain S-box-containing protein
LVEYIGTVIDVTEQKRAEEALRTSERNLRLIVDTIPGLVHTMTAAGEVEYINQQILDYFGKTRDELKDWTSNDILYPDDRASVVDRWIQSVKTGLPFDLEHRVRRADGTYRWFHSRGLPLRDTDGQVVRWYNLLIDIDDRKRAEEALRASERELRLIAESIPGMIVVNTPDGANEYSTQRLLDYLGKKLADLKDLKWVSIVHPEDADSMVNKWLDSVKTGRPLEINYRMRRADGVYRWFQSRVEPLVNEEGKILRWYGLIIDVDNQINAAEALRKSQAKLAHVSRLTTMGELTASIAHEVNQPLTAVVNNANASISLLPKDTPGLEEVREALTEIIEDANRASEVIARVRQLAKRAPVEKSLLDLRDVVHDVLGLARYESVARHVTIRTDLSKDLPSVSGDRVQLQQVLLNLVINGMDAMNKVEESKRVLTICGRRETHDGTFEARISVSDSGVGLKPEEMERIFEAFYTTKPQGMGMGLAISHSIIEAHGGRLWAEPNQVPGVTFLFSLPTASNAVS